MTPAKECGLRAGDLDVSLDGKSINSINKLAEAVESSWQERDKNQIHKGEHIPGCSYQTGESS